MKQLLLFSFLLFANAAFAQQGFMRTGDVDYTPVKDSLFAPLNKSLIPYGILYERVAGFAALNGITDETPMSTGLIKQAWSELQRANYNFKPAPDTLNYSHLRDLIFSENVTGRIPLLAVNMHYASIDTMAFSDGRMVIGRDSLYYDGTGGSPYVQKQATLFALGFERPVYQTDTFTLDFDRMLLLSNDTATITELIISDETGRKTWALKKGDKISFNLADSGLHRLGLEISFSTGRTLTLNQNIWVNWKPLAGPCETDTITITASIPFQGYDESTATAGIGQYKIFFRTDQPCNEQITQPIIISDAWDPQDERSADAFYERLAYEAGGLKPNLGDSLRALGYDIVILNYPANKYVEHMIIRYNPFHNSSPFGPPVSMWDTIYHYRDGGTDYIQRNAFILVKLLQDLKSQMPTGSNYKFAVIGPSMGGLITRYALSYMEKNGLDHNTRLWLSFDAPHHGANIPLGLQDMFRYLADDLNNETAKDVMNLQLRRPAARQMLISQTTGSISDLPNYIHNAAPDRVHWMNDLNAIGFPQNVRRIALVNGKGSGGMYHTPGSEMFTIKSYLAANPHQAALEATPYFMNSTYSKLVHVWKLFTWAYDLWGSFAMVYGPLDGSPGGMYDVQQDVYGPTEGSHDTTFLKSWGPRFYTPFISTSYVSNETHNMSFIPTVSGLALNNPNINWSQPIDVANLVCDNKTPFHSIFVPEKNENHITITEKNAPWIIEEIQFGQPGCLPICAQTITGNSCNKTSAAYSVDVLPPPGVTISWTTTGNINIPGANTGNTVSVSKSGSTGDGFLTATFNNHGCGANVTLSKRISTANPHSAAFNLTNATPNGCTLKGVANSYADEIYHWENGDGTQRSDYNLNVSPLPIYINNQAGNFIALQMENQCGLSTKVTKAAPGKAGCMPERPAHAALADTAKVPDLLVIYPNPTSSVWQFSVPDSKAALSVAVSDASGRKTYEQYIGGSPHFEVNARMFQPGMYLAVIRFADGSIKRYKIIRR